jgi:Tol biopolymer transport system component
MGRFLHAFVVLWQCAAPLGAADVPEPRYMGRIVLFGCDATGLPGISSMRPDGADVRSEFTAPEGRGVRHGRVSPDGRSLAFQAPRSGIEDQSGLINDIWILTDGKVRELGLTGFVGGWSPDSRRLVITQLVEEDQHRSILVDAATGVSEAVPLPEHQLVEDWSPDGTKLSVLLDRDDVLLHREVATFDLPTGALQPTFRPAQSDNIWGRFSPDGRQLAHHRRIVEGEPVVYHSSRAAVSSVDGRGTSDLTPLGRDRIGDIDFVPNSWPCWSPDGRELVWLRLGRDESGAFATFDLLGVSTEGRLPRRVPLDWARRLAGVDWK